MADTRPTLTSDCQIMLLESTRRVALVEFGRAANGTDNVTRQKLQEDFTSWTEIDSSNLQDWDSIASKISSCHRLVLLFHRDPVLFPSRLYQLAMDRCAAERRRMVHVVKNFVSKDGRPLLEHRRLEGMLHYVDLTGPGVDAREEVKMMIDSFDDDDEFSSPGESFAWQLVCGFLAYIAPDLQRRIKATLLDGEGSIKDEVLSQFGPDNQLSREKIFVLPKYFLLLKEQLALDDEESGATYPQKLFHGCEKIDNLSLEFDSPGYKKKVPVYLMKLSETVARGQSSFSHAVIYGGYAAPTFIIRELNKKTLDEKAKMFAQFKDELKFILSHPKLAQLLSEFGIGSSGETETSTVQLIDIDAQDFDLQTSVETVVGAELEKLASGQSVPESPAWQVSGNAPQTTFSSSVNAEVRAAVVNALNELSVGWTDPRSLLVLQRDDLRQCSQEYSNLMWKIEYLVKKMHESDKYNLSVIVVSDGNKAEEVDIFSVLPDSLTHLPDSCIVTVSSLSQLDNLQFAFPHGPKQSERSFEELCEALRLHEECVSTKDTLPLMSMAFAMAANIKFGFAKYLEDQVNRGRELKFDLPYLYVIPKSGRYSDDTELHRVMGKIEVTVGNPETFDQLANGRNYSYHVYESRQGAENGRHRLAFEIPPSLRGIRKQAACSFGGVKAGQLVHHLAEFRIELGMLLECNSYVKVIEWDDEFESCSDQEGISEASARNLLKLLKDQTQVKQTIHQRVWRVIYQIAGWWMVGELSAYFFG